MNPEENQPQAPTAGPAPEPTSPAAPAPAATSIPVTDQADVSDAINQLAADAAAAGGEPAPVPVSLDPTPAPEAPVVPETPVTPEAPAATSIPVSTPAPDIAAAVTEMDADAVLDAIDQPETTPESEIPAAIGVDPVASANAATSINVTTPEDSTVPADEGGEDGAKIVSEEDGDKEPIEPAEPVPGSIGSAINYSATAPDHSEPTKKPTGLAALFAKKPKPEAPAAPVETPAAPEETPAATIVEAPAPEAPTAPEHTFSPDLPVAPALTDKKGDKKNSIILAGIILGAVVLVAIIVFIIVFIVTSGDNKTTTTNNEKQTVVEAEPEETSLVCSYASTAEDITNAKNKALASYELKMIANYADDDLIDISISGVYNYTDADAASEGARQARLAYAREYNKLGLKEDPFSSNYPVAGTSFTASHFANADELDDTNAALFYLSANSRGIVVTSKDTIRNIFTKKGYECSGSEEKKNETDEKPIIDDDTTEDEDTLDGYTDEDYIDYEDYEGEEDEE